MTASELIEIINQQRVSLSVSTWILLIVFSLASSFVGALIVSYAQEKGKNYATREDFIELQSRLVSNTEAVERLKDNIARSSAIEQKRWEYKLEHYLGLILALEDFSRLIHQFYIFNDSLDKGYATPEEAKSELDNTVKIYDDSMISFHRHAVSIKLFCSNKMKKEIERLQDEVHGIGETLYNFDKNQAQETFISSIKKINSIEERFISNVKMSLFSEES